MPTFMQNVSTINNVVRTLLLLALVGGLGCAGWYVYATYNAGAIAARRAAQQLAAVQTDLQQTRDQLEQKEQIVREKDVEIHALDNQVRQQQREIQRLNTSLQLLKVTHRVARLVVLDQSTDAEPGENFSLVEFQEIDNEGDSIDKPKQFRIKGDLVYIDSWIVKFDDKYVEAADIDRSTSLVVFRRIFGEYQEPSDGFVLDQEGVRPAAYRRGGRVTAFEEKIWDDFWSLANDEVKLGQLGIRAAHGDAPSIRVQKGKSYRIDLRAADGLSITPEGAAPPRIAKPAA